MIHMYVNTRIYVNTISICTYGFATHVLQPMICLGDVQFEMDQKCKHTHPATRKELNLLEPPRRRQQKEMQNVSHSASKDVMNCKLS